MAEIESKEEKKFIYRLEQSDGSYKIYDVSSMSEEAQKSYHFLNKIHILMYQLRDKMVVLQDSERHHIGLINNQITDEMLTDEGVSDDDSKPDEKQD